MLPTHRITPIVLMPIILTTILLATILLTSCDVAPSLNDAPEYGKVVTVTPMLATATLKTTATSALAPTQRPNAKEAAIAWTKAAMTYDSQEAASAVSDRICALASEYGCWKAQRWNRKDLYAQYPNVKSQPVIKSAKLFYAGKMSDGLEYEIWEVLGEHSNPWRPEKKTFYSYPTFVFSAEIGRWEFFYSPDGLTAGSLVICGQFVEYAADGHMYSSGAEWEGVYAQCKTATPLPPTPFVPVTPIFTPKP